MKHSSKSFSQTISRDNLDWFESKVLLYFPKMKHCFSYTKQYAYKKMQIKEDQATIPSDGSFSIIILKIELTEVEETV